MRWLVLLLLVGNLVYLGWELQRDTALRVRNTPTVTRNQPDSGQLRLIRELDSPPLLRQSDTIEARALEGEQQTGLSATDQLVSRLPGFSIPAAAGRADGQNCFSYGPVPDEAQLTRLREWFQSREITTVTRQTQEQGRQLFWIYLAPRESRETAVALLRELHQQGISDYRLINRGNLENAISLGLFSTQAAVNDRLNELKGKGYKPVVVPYLDVSRIYWLDIKTGMAPGLINEAAGAYPARFKRTPIRCDSLP